MLVSQERNYWICRTRIYWQNASAKIEQIFVLGNFNFTDTHSGKPLGIGNKTNGSIDIKRCTTTREVTDKLSLSNWTVHGHVHIDPKTSEITPYGILY